LNGANWPGAPRWQVLRWRSQDAAVRPPSARHGLGLPSYFEAVSVTRVAVWVAVHRCSARFTEVHVPGLTCGTNAYEPW